MGINRVQFQKGLSMAKFMERYGTEEKRHAARVASRWPDPGSTAHRVAKILRSVIDH